MYINMKQLFINKDDLEKHEIDEEAIRSKGLVINDKNELLLVYNGNTFQFPGGHRKKEESLEETLLREVQEETGIDMIIENGPFMTITEYCRNYRNTNKNRCNKIYYYVVKCNDLPNYEKINLSDFERQTEFKLSYVKLDKIEEFLEQNIKNKKMDDLIGYEMIEVLKYYKQLIGGNI